MTFGEYIKARRKSLHLKQDEIKGLSQTYISDIELGNRIPRGADIIEKLAAALQLPADRLVWLQVYALLNKNPDEYFGRATKNGNVVTDAQNQSAAHATPELCVGATPADVVKILGEPSKEVRFGSQMYWFYADLKLRVVFKDDRVAALETI